MIHDASPTVESSLLIQLLFLAIKNILCSYWLHCIGDFNFPPSIFTLNGIQKSRITVRKISSDIILLLVFCIPASIAFATPLAFNEPFNISRTRRICIRLICNTKIGHYHLIGSSIITCVPDAIASGL